MKDVVHALERSCLFDGADRRRLFHDANELLIAHRAAAVTAWFYIRHVVAHAAQGELPPKLQDRVREPFGVLTCRAENMKCEAFRTSCADSGQPLQLAN